MVIGQVAGAFAGCSDLKATTTCPIHVLADERRLVTPGQAVDNPGLGGLLCQQWAGQYISLNVDHHDMVARGDGFATVTDTRTRCPSGFDDNVQRLRIDQR